MMIKKLVTGCLQKLNLKRNGKLDKKIIDATIAFQQQYPDMLLCGSVALILSDVLPYREVHDIDFVINKQHFEDNNLWLLSAPYPDETHSEYVSYEMMCNDILINVLVFDDHVKLNESTIISPYKTTLKCQDLNNILIWKRKYNRSKDIEDINNINKAIEDAIFSEE